jgi:hypothetical protein
MGTAKITNLLMLVLAGALVIYAVLWMLSSYTALSGQLLMPLYLPLSFLWAGACIFRQLMPKRRSKPRTRSR